MFTRRHFLATGAALFSAPIAGPLAAQSADWAEWDAQVTPSNYDPTTSNPWNLQPRFLPRRVYANSGLRPGDVHVDAVARYLYVIEEGGTAMRYGVAIGRGDLYMPGTYRVGRKAQWPSWTPTATMIQRNPEYAQWAGGMAPGPENPLGARALYLYWGDRDTYLRIHGTPQPWSIGYRASSGCVRMVMRHIMDIYDMVPVGATVHLYPGERSFSS